MNAALCSIMLLFLFINKRHETDVNISIWWGLKLRLGFMQSRLWLLCILCSLAAVFLIIHILHIGTRNVADVPLTPAVGRLPSSLRRVARARSTGETTTAVETAPPPRSARSNANSCASNARWYESLRACDWRTWKRRTGRAEKERRTPLPECRARRKTPVMSCVSRKTITETRWLVIYDKNKFIS